MTSLEGTSANLTLLDGNLQRRDKLVALKTDQGFEEAHDGSVNGRMHRCFRREMPKNCTGRAAQRYCGDVAANGSSDGCRNWLSPRGFIFFFKKAQLFVAKLRAAGETTGAVV